MNDLSPAKFQEFYTAREIAEIVLKRGIPSLPTTKRGINDYIRAAGWNDLPARLRRPRKGKGGGVEYHITVLPQVLRDALSGWDERAVLESAHQAVVDAAERQLTALRLSALSPVPRRVMQARSEILRSIDGYAIAMQQKRSWAIARFLEAQAEFHLRQAVEAKRDAGAALGDRELASLGVALRLTAADGFQLDPAKLAVANDRRGDAKVTRSTLYGWFKAWDGRGVLALAPTPPRKDQGIPPAFKDFLRFYARPAKPTVAQAYKDYAAEAAAAQGVQNMTLTLDQVHYILRHKLNDIEKHVGREGLLTLRSRLAYVTRTTEDMWPTTVYTADGKTFDAEVADPVTRNPIRPEITSVLDVATRKCVGFAVSRKENVIAVTEALRRSIGAHGICAIFYVDRGVGYKNKTFDADVGGLMGRLGITKMHALPYNSQGKGLIERFNAVWNDLARRQPTYISRDMDKEAKDAVHRETRRDLRLFGSARLLPTWEEFIQAAERTIAEYNDRPHDGLPRFEDPATGRLRHMSPNEAWAAHVANGFEAVTVAPEEEDDLFRPYEIRVVQRAQVTLYDNSYFDHALEPYHKRQVMVGYDYHQADRVWVREFDLETGQPGRLICVAGFMANAQRYVPVAFEQKALENRVKTRLKRAANKTASIEAELQAPFQIEQQAAVDPWHIETAEPDRESVPEAAPSNVEILPTPKRQTFASDEELAAWALQNPGELKPNQIAVLVHCMNDSTARKLFELSGIDTEALRNLLRAVA